MCSSHRPEAGADSMPIDLLDIGCPNCGATYTASEPHECEKPYRVLIEEYDGGRAWLTVRAIGPNGAKHTARQTALDKGYDVVAVLEVKAA